MGKLLPSYKKSIIDELQQSISTNTSNYYVFASNPVATEIQPTSNDDFSLSFVNNWNLLFGKKLANTNFIPIIKNNVWESNTVYDRYDNTSQTLHFENNFYVFSSPAVLGGGYNVYKCIDNANGNPSSVNPGSIGTPTQSTTFETSDGYKWRYVSTISSLIYNQFFTEDYAPIYPNTSLSAAAATYAGVDVVVVSNGGIGYETYTNGVIQSTPNSTLIQLQTTAFNTNDYYNNNAIYIYNGSFSTGQLRSVSDYISNSAGRWVVLDSAANLASIFSGTTNYYISPKVVFETDGDSEPLAYTTINTVSNSISSVVILETGSNISRANVSIQSNTVFGFGANVYAIVPPPGGHGYDPVTELNVKGIGMFFTFANSETNTIITDTLYNKIGIIKDPYSLTNTGSKGSLYTSNTFSQVLKANVNPTFTFSNGETVTGVNSGSKGVVVFSNSSTLYLVGDKSFADGELIANNNGDVVTSILINTLGDVYSKDITPLYTQNINNVTRSDSQSESFKIIIQI
jgi:hypothetical protein